MTDRGIYLYAVTRSDRPIAPSVVGHGGRPVSALAHRDLAAVVSDVELDEFGEEALKRNLEDLSWLERVARRHNEVVHALAGSGPVAPVRLATIYLDESSVRQRLEQLHEQLASVLERVQHRHEWSVKVISTSEPAETRAPAADDGGEPLSGAAYLRRKRQLSVDRARDAAESESVADRVYEQLSARAVGGRRLQPQDPRISGHRGTMVLNAAFLVDEAQQDAFTALAATLSDQLADGSLTLAGPWPPYSFATLEEL